jgi:predicted DNA-binding WGR domain protein
MTYIRLERIEPGRNKYRFYLVICARTLWGTWAIRREWGRIGQRFRGTRIDECADQDDALHLAAETIELRMRHGYTAKRTIPAAVRDARDASNTASEE